MRESPRPDHILPERQAVPHIKSEILSGLRVPDSWLATEKPVFLSDFGCNRQTTDDHLMHITGMLKDQNGTIYYKTKNSWGEDRNPFGGYLYMSEPFCRLQTVAIMVHKDAIPKAIRKKLGL